MIRRFLSLLLLLALQGCHSGSAGSRNVPSSGAWNPSYTTDFQLTEAAMSEGGEWINGRVTGLDWDNVQTAKNFAFGTPPTGKYTDPTAVLKGTWTADQKAGAIVSIREVSPRCCHEVELRLRTTISAHSITGYEINCSVAKKKPYVEIVRWNGPLNSFDYVAHSDANGCGDRDLLEATIIGATIVVYKNGTQVLRGTDSHYASGAPGIGFYETDNNVGYFGFSRFIASNVSPQNENHVSGLFKMIRTKVPCIL